MKIKLIGVVFGLIFLMSSLAFGLLKYLPLEYLKKNAEIIVLGEVRNIRPFWNEAKNKILTEVSLAPQKFLKGREAQEIKVIVQGGVIGRKGLWVSDQPQFQKGEKVILFLTAGKLLGREVLGWQQGKFQVVKDKTTQQDLVITPDFHGLSGAGIIQHFQSKKIPLGEFLQKIESQ